jgi:hypothetical protein
MFINIKTFSIVILVMGCVFEARAQDLPNLMDLNLGSLPRNVKIAGSIPVRGNNAYEMTIYEFGLPDHEKDHQAVILLSPEGKRAVLQLGLIYEKSGVEIELACEWKKTSNKNDLLIGLTNSKSLHLKHYAMPYKAWLVKIDQSPPQFVPVNAKLVQCLGGAVD